MKLPVRTTLAGIAAATVLTAAVAGAAFAAPVAAAPRTPAAPAPAAAARTCLTERQAAQRDPSVTSLRALGDCEIGRRLTTLDTLAAAVAGSETLAAADRAALTNELGATRSGLVALKGTIDAETSIGALKGEVSRIATDFRVYVLVSRQVRLVVAADRAVAATTLLGQLSAKLQARIDAARSRGRDVAAAQAALTAMNASAADAAKLAAAVPGRVLPLTPAGYNAGTAAPVLDAARHALGTARLDLLAAREDARQVVADLH